MSSSATRTKCSDVRVIERSRNLTAMACSIKGDVKKILLLDRKWEGFPRHPAPSQLCKALVWGRAPGLVCVPSQRLHLLN
jgi:hypothetical protein